MVRYAERDRGQIMWVLILIIQYAAVAMPIQYDSLEKCQASGKQTIGAEYMKADGPHGAAVSFYICVKQ